MGRNNNSTHQPNNQEHGSIPETMGRMKADFTIQRRPILMEISKMTYWEALEYTSGTEGFVANPNGKVYAIMGWVYDDELEEYL